MADTERAPDPPAPAPADTPVDTPADTLADTPADMRSVNMDFHYNEEFGDKSIPEAYERLLLNALEGDAALFTRSDGIEAAWRTIDSILQAWESGIEPMATYAPGSWGPQEAEKLL